MLSMDFKFRFITLWNKMSLDSGEENTISSSEQVVKLLFKYYDEPHRFYHTLKHIDYSLNHFDQIKLNLDNAEAVELAIWFHDVIYKAGSQDNEQKSAELFKKLATESFNCANAEEIISSVYQLILVTTHFEPISTNDEKYIVDIDLSSFSETSEFYQENNEDLRREQSHVDDKSYFLSHHKFLNYLLERETIYYTNHFIEKYEKIARANIINYIQ